jgi:putative Ca2+/H+ antiporter (TMEM165/GDT1 family)
MEALLASTGLVAIAEIGDKTQLLAIVLAARFLRPLPIIAGIFCATILNHAGAAALGYFASTLISGLGFQLLIAAAFIGMGLWALVPDKEDEAGASRAAGGVFLTTLVAFFMVEIGDKTQIATSLLAAKYQAIALVAVGTTIGMMIANVPAVYFGEAVTKVVPLKYVRWTCAAIFIALGAGVLIAALAR